MGYQHKQQQKLNISWWNHWPQVYQVQDQNVVYKSKSGFETMLMNNRQLKHFNPYTIPTTPSSIFSSPDFLHSNPQKKEKKK